MQDFIELCRSQVHIVEDAHRVDFRPQMDIGEAVLGSYINRACGEQKEYSYKGGTTAEACSKPSPTPCRDGRHNKGREVETHATEDGPEDVGKQFASFIGLRGKEVEEHIYRHHRPTEDGQEHQLEGVEQDQSKEPPIDAPWTLGSKQQEHIHREHH